MALAEDEVSFPSTVVPAPEYSAAMSRYLVPVETRMPNIPTQPSETMATMLRACIDERMIIAEMDFRALARLPRSEYADPDGSYPHLIAKAPVAGDIVEVIDADFTLVPWDPVRDPNDDSKFNLEDFFQIK